MPNSIVKYTHRVNRTGRNANEIRTSSSSYAIVTEDDVHLVADVLGILQQTNQVVNPALLILIPTMRFHLLCRATMDSKYIQLIALKNS